MSALIASTYSTSSVSGLVSSNRRLTLPAELLAEAEVEADRLGVADVEVAVRLGRKAGHDAAAVLACLHVLGDEVFDEITRLIGGAGLGSVASMGGES